MEEQQFEYEKVEQFNKDVAEWSKKLQDAVRASAANAVSSDNRLSRSITSRLRKKDGEVYNIGLKIAKEGIYIHTGASCGHGGGKGGTWRDRYGNKRTTAPSSLGKANTGNRKAHEFLNPVIDQLLPELNEIAVKYMTNNSFNPEEVSIRLKL